MVAPLVAAAGAQAALSAGQSIAQAMARPQGHWEQERVGRSLVTVRRGVHPSAAGIAAVLIGTAAVGGVWSRHASSAWRESTRVCPRRTGKSLALGGRW